jgi:hypothetical protein
MVSNANADAVVVGINDLGRVLATVIQKRGCVGSVLRNLFILSCLTLYITYSISFSPFFKCCELFRCRSGRARLAALPFVLTRLLHVSTIAVLDGRGAYQSSDATILYFERGTSIIETSWNNRPVSQTTRSIA